MGFITKLVEKAFVGAAVATVGAAKLGSTVGHCSVVAVKAVGEAVPTHNERIKEHATGDFRARLSERLNK